MYGVKDNFPRSTSSTRPELSTVMRAKRNLVIMKGIAVLIVLGGILLLWMFAPIEAFIGVTIALGVFGIVWFFVFYGVDYINDFIQWVDNQRRLVESSKKFGVRDE